MRQKKFITEKRSLKMTVKVLVAAFFILPSSLFISSCTDLEEKVYDRLHHQFKLFFIEFLGFIHQFNSFLFRF